MIENLDEFVIGVNPDEITQIQLDTFKLYIFEIESDEELDNSEYTHQELENVSRAVLISLCKNKKSHPKEYLVSASFVSPQQENLGDGENLVHMTTTIFNNGKPGKKVGYYLVYKILD